MASVGSVIFRYPRHQNRWSPVCGIFFWAWLDIALWQLDCRYKGTTGQLVGPARDCWTLFMMTMDEWHNWQPIRPTRDREDTVHGGRYNGTTLWPVRPSRDYWTLFITMGSTLTQLDDPSDHHGLVNTVCNDGRYSDTTGQPVRPARNYWTRSMMVVGTTD